MRIALLMNPWQLTFRGKWTWDDIYNDPRGMSGSELGFVEIGKQLHGLGHEVTMYTDTDAHTFANAAVADKRYVGHWVLPWADLQRKLPADLAIAINHPGGLEHFDCPKVCLQWLNSFEYCSRAEYEQVDLWLSPSQAHKDYLLGYDSFGFNERAHDLADDKVVLDYRDWRVLPLGCTPELYDGIEKVPGRVVYTSSPDRGLHHLLHVWPHIKRAVPHAELEIYYRLRPWIAELKAAPDDFAPIQENRQRALFVDEALRRLEGDKWGVRVMGAVSRNRIARAIGEAECFAYPTATLRFSEGFSCSTLEACAAGACPVIWDCDALGQFYRDAAEVLPRGDEERFTATVIRALTDKEFRCDSQRKSVEFAAKHTWNATVTSLLQHCQALSRGSRGQSPESAIAGSGPAPDTAAATGWSESTTDSSGCTG